MAYDKCNNKYSTFFIDYFYDGFRGHSQGKHAGKWNEKKARSSV